MNFLVRQSKSITHLKLPLMHPQDWGGQEFFQDPLFLPNIRVLETNGGTIEKIFQGRDIKVLRFIRGLGSLTVILKGFRLYGENLTALHLWSINGMALQPLRAMLGATPNLRLLGSIDCTPKYRASTLDSELLDILGTLRYLEAIEFFTPRWPLQQPWRDFVSLILSGKQFSRLRFAYIVGWGPQICTIRPTNAREWAFTEEDSPQVTPHEQWDSLVAEIIGSASP
ncbi:hypothetical protein SISNIDRAFT_167647 [Sistotremastrum niveocremeum HHB9708]|uniref:F-box domain-containing protein n=1 Tax=Sistotremastrum niveocremeum HHB9708 TaxID=1314777 RepID=A0A164SAK2_9AGAM|nr:hypothetical protein SISNIDRAFT_167647 [Sistotremastrum niveocremeum HHB9708]